MSNSTRAIKWLPIPGYEGLYEVSDQGGVRRLARKVTQTNGKVLNLSARSLKLTPVTQGYLSVGMTDNALFRKTHRVHRLVLEAFVGPAEEGEWALHFNDIADDNRLVNLRWGTPSENTHDRVRNGKSIAPRPYVTQPGGVGLSLSARWVPIPGYEGIYEISDEGHVRTLARVIMRSSGLTYTVNARVRQPTTMVTGYLALALNRHGKQSPLQYVHRLVLAAFVRAPEKGELGLHHNDVRDDNRLGNLRWGTAAENQQDTIRNGGRAPNANTHCQRGHEFSGDNLFVTPDGYRNCRICRTVSVARYKERLELAAQLVA